MAQQIKKKFLAPEVIEYFDNQIDAVEQLAQDLEQEKADLTYVDEKDEELSEAIESEAQARQAADEDLQSQIDTEKGRIDAILDASEADKDSFKEIVDLINSVDTENDEAFAGYVLSNNERSTQIEQDLSDLEDRVEVLENTKEVIEEDDLASFPQIGEVSKIYVAKDSNRIYRYEESEGGGEIELPQAPAMPELTPTISITDADDLQATINAASNGDVIFLANGTYSYAGLSITKEIALVGESQAGVLVQDTRTNSQTFMTVSVDNVVLKDMTIRHSTTDTNIGWAISASGPGFPQVRLNNFRMYNVKSQYSKGGLAVRSNNFVVQGCTFEVVAGSSTRRGILHYGNGGNSFIKNNHFINATTGALRAVTPTATSGSNPSDDQAGSLTIEGSTFTGNLSQFVNMDNHQGAAGSFELIVKDNVTPETNAFVVSFGGVNNFGDLFSRIVLIGNTLTNNHALGLGKGVLAIDGVSGPRPFRSSTLPIVSMDNTLGQLDFRSGYAEAAGSTGSIVGYATAQINEPTVELVEAEGSSGQYVELSQEPDLSIIESDIVSLDARLDVIEGSSEGSIAKALQDSKEYTDQKVADLVGSAPEVLDTLKELADALGGDENFAATVASQIGDIDDRLDALEAFGYEQVVHVSKNGLDTNSGKQHSPFLTITAAMNSITDASPAKRYAIKVAAGAYSEAIALKANVFIIGDGQKESVRITGAVSMHSSFSGTADHRSGFSAVTLLSATDFNWATVTSAAGKLYFNEVIFGSTVNMYGHNNAIAQAQFNACIIFGALTISGINVGVFSNNVCYGNINLNQHPNGGMATILVASGGYCQGTITQTASVNDFSRRSASFLRNFNSEKLVINGPSVYADVDLISQGKQLPEISNGANLIALNPRINHDMTTQMIVPKNTNAHNMGDWGKQWFWNFGYVHASSGTDLFLISYPESYAPDSSGKSIGIYTDGAGLQQNVNGGEIALQTAATSGTGVRGKITLDGRLIDVTSKQIKNLANATDASDAVNKAQLDSIVQFNKESKTVDETILSNEYVDLAFLAKPNSIVMFVGRLAMIEGSDYSVSVVEGVTRVTFLAPMLVPSEEALELDDLIHFTYAK